MTVIPEGTQSTGGDDKVELTKEQYDELVRSKAEKAQNEANMAAELADLRKKNAELKVTQNPALKPEDISKVIDEEFKKRELSAFEVTKESALDKFLGSHPEFSTEEDKDGLKLKAFQKALARMNVVGLKTEDDYTQVLQDALRLSEEVTPQTFTPNFSSTPRISVTVPGSKSSVQLTSGEAKLVQNNFGGNVEAYLKAKAKRPEYIEELLKWIR